MKFQKIITVFTFVVLVTTISFAQNTFGDITLKNLDGKEIKLQDYADNGKITVVNFWATWCSPCKKELDNIAELYPEWQEDYNVEIVAISTDNTRSSSKVKPMVNAKEWEYDVLLDPNRTMSRTLNFQAVPYTVVLDQKGNIVYKHSGYVEGDEYELEDKIKELYQKNDSEDVKKDDGAEKE